MIRAVTSARKKSYFSSSRCTMCTFGPRTRVKCFVFNISRFCCRAVDYSQVTVQCDGFTMGVYVISACGCGQCGRPSIVYSATARGQNGNGLL